METWIGAKREAMTKRRTRAALDSKVVTVRLSRDTYNQLAAIVEATQIPMSSLLRLCVEDLDTIKRQLRAGLDKVLKDIEE